MNILKKISLCTVSLIMAVTVTVQPLHAEEDFSSFLDRQFNELIGESYMTAHFALKDTEEAGITTFDSMLGEPGWDSYEEAVHDFQRRLNELHGYDRNKLNEEEKNDYDTYEFYLENMIELNGYPYFDSLFTPSSSAVESLETNLSEFVFRDKEDYEQYLNMLAEVPEFLSECMEVTKKQAEKGYFLTSEQLEKTCSVIESFTEKTDTNALMVAFEDALKQANDLSEEEKNDLRNRNRELILQSVIPSFKETEESLKQLKGSRKGSSAIADLKDGKDYYAAYAKYKTGSKDSVEDMLETCTEYLNLAIEQYVDLYRNNDPEDLNETVSFTSPEEILAYLQENIEDLPKLGEVNYTVNYLDPSIAPPSVNAYYVQPPLDDINQNVMKINGDNVSDHNDLYSTLAHEGFPGHLYQTVYYYKEGGSRLRYLTDAKGFTEGWGMYAETLGWKVAPVNTETKEMQCVNITLNYVLDAAVDLGVNGLGWSIRDVENYLNKAGLNPDIAGDLYDFVTLQPGTILPYGYGIAKILMLRQYAKQALQKEFVLQEFNEVLLKGGARPFDKVETDIEEWIVEKGGIIEEKVNEDNYVWWFVGGIAAALVVVVVKRRGKTE